MQNVQQDGISKAQLEPHIFCGYFSCPRTMATAFAAGGIWPNGIGWSVLLSPFLNDLFFFSCCKHKKKLMKKRRPGWSSLLHKLFLPGLLVPFLPRQRCPNILWRSLLFWSAKLSNQSCHVNNHNISQYIRLMVPLTSGKGCRQADMHLHRMSVMSFRPLLRPMKMHTMQIVSAHSCFVLASSTSSTTS